MAAKQKPARDEKVQNLRPKATPALNLGPSQLTGKQRQSPQNLRSRIPIPHDGGMGDEKTDLSAEFVAAIEGVKDKFGEQAFWGFVKEELLDVTSRQLSPNAQSVIDELWRILEAARSKRRRAEFNVSSSDEEKKTLNEQAKLRMRRMRAIKASNKLEM